MMLLLLALLGSLLAGVALQLPARVSLLRTPLLSAVVQG